MFVMCCVICVVWCVICLVLCDVLCHVCDLCCVVCLLCVVWFVLCDVWFVLCNLCCVLCAMCWVMCFVFSCACDDVSDRSHLCSRFFRSCSTSLSMPKRTASRDDLTDSSSEACRPPRKFRRPKSVKPWREKVQRHCVCARRRKKGSSCFTAFWFQVNLRRCWTFK